MSRNIITLIFLIASAIITSCKGQLKSGADFTFKSPFDLVIGDTVTKLGNNIMLVYQAKNNIFWFGSWETGVYKYDGISIINYTKKHGLPHNRIDEIKEDKAGNIYFNSCYPFSAITKFDGRIFTKMQVKASNDWQLRPDDLWFKHPFETRHIYRYNGFVLHELQIPKPPNISNPFEIYSIYKDSKGNIWFGTNPVGVCRYNGISFDWITESDVTELHGGPANGVRSITEDINGDFWFNAEYRYSIYDSATLNSKKFYTRKKSIGSLDGKPNSILNEYLSILKDRNYNLWFATYLDGVWKYDGNKITHYPIQSNSVGINTFSIYQDNNDNIWIGTHQNGTFKLNGNEFEQFRLR